MNEAYEISSSVKESGTFTIKLGYIRACKSTNRVHLGLVDQLIRNISKRDCVDFWKRRARLTVKEALAVMHMTLLAGSRGKVREDLIDAAIRATLDERVEAVAKYAGKTVDDIWAMIEEEK